MTRRRRASSFVLCAMRLAIVVAAAASIASPAAAAHAALRADSVVAESLGPLSGQFADRYITGIEYTRPGVALRSVPDPRLFVSDDGLHMAFLLDLVTSTAIVLDGVEGKTYRNVGGEMFSLDGGHFAYSASPSSKGRSAIVVDGREIPIEGDFPTSVLLSPDGRRWAFVSQEPSDFRRSQFVSTERGGGRLYDSVSLPRFSWDGSRLGYVGHRAERSVVVIDDRETPEYDEVTSPVFDLSGRHIAYGFRSGGGWRVMRDGTPGDSYEDIEEASIRFSPDGRRLAYVAQIGRTQMLVVDGEPGRTWAHVTTDTSVFSPDGNRTACWIQESEGTAAPWFPVVDDRKLATQQIATEGVGRPGRVRFSIDGKHVVHAEFLPRVGSLRANGVWQVVVDGTPGPEFDAVGVPALSNNGRVAYAACRGQFEAVVIDDALGPWFQIVGRPVFSPNGTRVAYSAMIANDRACIVVDGSRGPEFEYVIPNGPHYHPDGTLEYLAVRHSTLYRVRHIPR